LPENLNEKEGSPLCGLIGGGLGYRIGLQGGARHLSMSFGILVPSCCWAIALCDTHPFFLPLLGILY